MLIVQLLAGLLECLQLLLQQLLGLRDHFGSCAQLVQAALVSSGNFLNNAQPVQQIGKTARLEQHVPIGKGPILLHSADAVLVFFVQLVKQCLRLIQLCLLIGDQDSIGRDLLVDQVDLRIQQGLLLLQRAFLIHKRLNL